MKLRELARVIRSKNAGPLTLVIDILFDTRDRYDLAVASPGLSRESMARVYRVDQSDVKVIHVPLALALKVTFARPIVAGSPGDRDVYGAQQHRQLLEIEV